MKDEDLKLEEIEGSPTLGGEGEGHVQGKEKWREYISYFAIRNTIFKWSTRIRHKGEVSVAKKNHEPEKFDTFSI